MELSENIIDVGVANRFISSLSKSLQALCHGCMDFDSGIEIVGYINVNIDCGGKVDYVLNEKVQKRQDNSMTFVSNSFLAKKEQEKKLRDGSCSPVKELQVPQFAQPTSNHSRFHKGAYSSFSRVLSSARRKRGWSGTERDWRVPARKIPHHSTSQTYQNSSPYSSSESHLSSDFSEVSNFHQPAETLSNFGAGDINVKTECVDSVGESHSLSGHLEDTSQNLSSFDNSVDNKVIKKDPDMISDQTPESSSLASEVDKSDNIHHDSSIPAPVKSAEVSFFDSEDQGGSANNPGYSGDANQYSSAISNLSHSNAEQVNVFEVAENESYLNTTADQDSFDDVIEIGDEDEDYQGAYDSQHSQAMCGLVSSGITNSVLPRQLADGFFYCPFCREPHSTEKQCRQHISHKHSQQLPFPCSQCSRGFFTASGLYRHTKFGHQGSKDMVCVICDLRFHRRDHLQCHLRRVHRLDHQEAIEQSHRGNIASTHINSFY